jgi:hypothetical protein
VPATSTDRSVTSSMLIERSEVSAGSSDRT